MQYYSKRCVSVTENVVSESEGILDVLRDVAVHVVVKVAPKKPQQFSNDPEIMSLPSERKAINQENCKVKGPSAFDQEEIKVS